MNSRWQDCSSGSDSANHIGSIGDEYHHIPGLARFQKNPFLSFVRLWKDMLDRRRDCKAVADMAESWGDLVNDQWNRGQGSTC